MKKLIPVMVVVAVLGAAGYYYMNQNKSNTPQTLTEQIGEANEWSTAIASGRPTMCTMTRGEDKMDYLIMGKKMKATITASTNGTQNTSYMINDEIHIYVWQEGQMQGTKMTIPTEEEMAKMAEDAKQYQSQMPDTPNLESESGFDSLKNEGYTIDCSSTSATSADFVPPSNITFIDPMEAMKKAVPTNGGEIDIKALEEMAKQYGGQ